MKVYMAADHAGFELKEHLKKYLHEEGYAVIDNGPKEYDKQDDYPLTTEKTIKHIDANPQERAVLICKNGVGVTIFANKFKRVRAGLSWTPHHAKSHKLDDHTNILTLPAAYITPQKAVEITLAWLQTLPSAEPRHERRIRQIEELSA
ncbi:RpiB/LacA/LacB family sugar-phosphate isomerase [candidate division WWE3 bacterium]|nr:RpiB/LacA/LacB family sugar-phosphate isomerase [candidate division WWE3 bacterium]